MVSGARRALAGQFEAGAYLSFWLAACALAVIAGRPWLGAIGLVTVVPLAVLAMVRRRTGRLR